MIKAVIFDMDGTLIDSEPLYLKVTLQCMQEFGIPACEEDLFPLVGANSTFYSNFIDKKIEGYVSREEYEKWNEDYFKKYPVDNSKILFPHVHETISELKKQGYRLILASSSKKWEIEKMLRQTELTDYFEFFLSGEMFRVSKPNPEIYLTCIEKLGLSAEECIAIEDSEYGIAAAKAANLTCIAKRDTRYGFNQTAADYMVDDLLDIIQIINNKG